MDRFIGLTSTSDSGNITFLKSNMDRFIALKYFAYLIKKSYFKIQYGQIYRALKLIRDT